MKIFANKSIWKKIVIIFLLITSISFATPEPVQAGFGGELMEPICDLLVGLADGFMNVTHNILIGQETTIIRVNLNDSMTSFFRVAITAIVFLVVLAAAAALTAGGALAVGAVTGAVTSTTAGSFAAAAIIANIVPILVGSTYFGVKAYSNDAFDHELNLPLYSISPERIFSNTIPLFDVNFFHPSAEPYKYEWIHKTTFDDKYQPIYNDDYLDFSNGEDVTTSEMKDRICKSGAASITNPDLIKEIKKIKFGGTTYYQVKRSGNMGSADYYITLREKADGNLELAQNLDFSNAEDMTSEEIQDLETIGDIDPGLVSEAKKIEIGGVKFIRFKIRRPNKNLSSCKSRRGFYSIWNRGKIFVFT